MKKSLLLSSTILLFTSYMFSQGAWTQKTDFGGTARSTAIGFSIGTKGYIGTGVDGGSVFRNDFWEWDQLTNVWTQKANFGGTGRSEATGFSIGTKGYIGTGYNGIVPPYGGQDFWEWDQATNTWSQKANFGGASRWNAVSFSINTKGYIGTGFYSTGVGSSYNDFWEWDQITNVWIQKASFLGTARDRAVGFSIGSKGYIGTGGSGTQDFWEWDQATNTWSQKANFVGTARVGAVGFSIGTKGYIGAGSDGTFTSNLLNDFWEWDQATNTWTQKTNFPGILSYNSIGFSLGSKGYIGTGDANNGSVYYKDFWEFDPNGNGVNEIELEKLISVYPNPFSETTSLRITNSSELRITEIKMFDVSGKQIHPSIIRNSNSFVISRGSEADGVYFIHLTTDKGNTTKRIVLSH